MADSGGLAEDAARLRLDHDVHQQPTTSENVDEASDGAAPAPKIPTIVGNKRLWDITADFRSAAATLPTGHLIKDENFTLFESVAALEIMDAKMDSGLLHPGESLYDTYDVLRNLLPEEVIGIIDQLFQYEMAWHSGYPLSQSLFSCHYIDTLLWPDPGNLEACQFYRGQRPETADRPMLKVLRAYCVGLIKSCNLVNQLVLESHYFEEEDFSTHTFNRDLLSRIQDQAILRLLDEAINITNHATDVATNVQQALTERLTFRRELLTAFSQCASSTDEPAWHTIRNLAAALDHSHSVGRAVPDAFSHKIQRKLMSTVPPRPIIELSWEMSVQQIQQMCDECRAGFSAFDAAAQGPESTTAFLLTFSARTPEPLPYPRSYVSNVLLERIDETFPRILRRDLDLFVLPASEILEESNWTIEQPLSAGRLDPHFHYAQIIDDFASRAIPDFGGYIDFWRALCSNRCRLRRQLCHVLLRLDELQRDGEELDAKLKAIHDGSGPAELESPLFRYSYIFKLRVMEWIIQLGFELEVYLPDEHAGMYWLLSSVSKRREEQLRSILDDISRIDISNRRNQQQALNALTRSQHFLQAQIELASGTANLAEALYTIYTYLHYLRLMPDVATKQPHYDPALRYELRMKPFLTLQDGFREMYNDFQTVTHPFGEFDANSSDVANNAGPVCTIADKAVKDAKTNFAALKALGAVKAQARIVESEWLTEVSNLIKSAVAAGVAVSTLRTATAEGTLADVKLQFPDPQERYHRYWVTPKLAAN